MLVTFHRRVVAAAEVEEDQLVGDLQDLPSCWLHTTVVGNFDIVLHNRDHLVVAVAVDS